MDENFGNMANIEAMFDLNRFQVAAKAVVGTWSSSGGGFLQYVNDILAQMLAWPWRKAVIS